MASRKKKLKLSKKQRKQARAVALPAVIALACLVLGAAGSRWLSHRTPPANLVWGADRSIKVPHDLQRFLETKNDCKQYRGPDTPTGVGLWGVYQLSKGRYAKIAYGCSWNLSSYVMAVKDKGGWQLLAPAQYFAPFKDAVDPTKGALPFCTMIDKYAIPKEIEPFCVQADGTAKSNDRA